MQNELLTLLIGYVSLTTEIAEGIHSCRNGLILHKCILFVWIVPPVSFHTHLAFGLVTFLDASAYHGEQEDHHYDQHQEGNAGRVVTCKRMDRTKQEEHQKDQALLEGGNHFCR